MEKRQELYKGRQRRSTRPTIRKLLIMHYRDDVSAFDGAKLAKLDQKGETNNKINAYVMGKLADAGVATHFVRSINERESARQGLEDAAGRMCRAQHLRRIDGQALRHCRGYAARRTDLRVLP